MNASLRIKGELKVKTRRKKKEKNTSKIEKFENLQKAQPDCARTKAGVGAGACGDVFLPGETGQEG